MSILSTAEKPQDGPIVVTIIGDSGMGKTTLACSFPAPIVIRAEDGMQAIPAASRPDALPVITKTAQLWEQLRALGTEEHQYKTVVIDSVTAVERLFIDDVIAGDPKKPKGINQALGGYGNGVAAVAAMHQRVRRLCGKLNDKGMHVVFVAHADTEQIDLPDQDPYMRYSLRLGKKSVAPYVDDSDVVGFLKLQTYVMQDENSNRAKATTDGSRMLVTYTTAANVSKNRYGITKDLLVKAGENPLAAHIPVLQQTNKQTTNTIENENEE